MSTINKEDVTQYSLRFRPLYLRDVYGQDATVRALLKRSKENDWPQAICLRGPYGCGKSSIAFILAAMMQAHDITGEPIWDTPDNQAILNQTFDRDVLLLDASRWSSKDAMVEFTQSISTRPMYSQSGIRVCIIEEADQASNAAMLSLLKILESTKSYNKFILCSMEDKGIPNSVLSRCQCYQIKSIGVKDIMMNLKHIMEQTGDWTNESIPDEFRLQGLGAIAAAAQGSMRQAVQFLEQCIVNEAWTLDDIDNLIGVIDEEKTWRILDGLLEKSKDAKMWRTLVGLKTGDETNHFINYCSMLLSECMIYGITGFCYDGERAEGRFKKMLKTGNVSDLFYCITMHPQLNKPYTRTTDILSALTCYYEGVKFKPTSEEPVKLEELKPIKLGSDTPFINKLPTGDTGDTSKLSPLKTTGAVIDDKNSRVFEAHLDKANVIAPKVRAVRTTTPKASTTDIGSLNITWS